MRELLLGLLLVCLAGAVFAADNGDNDRIKELETKIEELQKQLDSVKSSSADIEEIHRQLAILAQEVEKQRSGEQETELSESDRRSLGLGPSAATVYGKKQGVSMAGYGEMLYENFAEETDAGTDPGKTSQLDFLRAVLYFGYRFNDRFLFNSEIEVEHANTGEGGEVAVEFAHIDYRATDELTLRGGMVLLPLGLVNEFHEPTVFLGARRPVTETVIIPSTWRENGFGLAGRSGMFDYRAYLTAGFNASGFSSKGLRNGRQEGARSRISSPSFSARIDLTPSYGLIVGGSLFAGKSRAFESDNEDLEVGTFIGELHGEYRARGFEFRALYAHASLNDVAKLNEALHFAGSGSVGKTLSGRYIQAGYNLFARRTESEVALIPYLRFESVNTQSSVPSGYTEDPANAQTIWTFGVQYLPITNIVLKTDYQIVNNDADSGVNQWNIELGYSF